MSHYLADLVAPMDALLLKGDASPTTRAIMTCALVLDTPPTTEQLRASFERASRAVPRMRQLVTVPLWAAGRAKWTEDEQFEVADHVRVVGVGGDRSLAAVLVMASDVATAPFDSARPLWDATLVTGLEEDRAVLLLRLHHAIADGVRTLHLMANLLDLQREPSVGDTPLLEQKGSGLHAVRDRVTDTVGYAMATQQQRADSATRLMLESVLRPGELVVGAARYTRSAVRTYVASGAEASPLLRSRSRSRIFRTLECPLADLKSHAKARSATVNDAFLAALLGGMRRYHEEMGAPVSDLPIAFPLDLAKDATYQSGNHFSAAVIAGPSSEPDADARLRRVHDLVLARRAEPGVDAPLRIAPFVHQVPSGIASAALSAYSRRVDLQASNIIGPNFAVFLAGARVDRFFAFGPLPGVALMSVLISYNRLCHVGFTIDPAAVTDPDLLMSCMDRAFREFAPDRDR